MSRPMPVASSSAIPANPSTLAGNQGSAQDFILFDESQFQGSQPQMMSTMSSQPLYQQQQHYPNSMMTTNQSSTMTSRPSFEPKSSFTEYRATQSGPQNESPFSSPASKPEDDFGSDHSHSGVGIAPSGTLAHGTPKPKRQRGHGYSSSWNGGNIQQHKFQNRQSTGGTLASAMVPTQSFGGYTGGGNGNDWSGSDTSPQNPPSGSFGPPIHSLSLGEASDGGSGLSSLFPVKTNSSTQATASDFIALQAALQASNIPTSTAFQHMTPQQQQEERSRQQIRAELMGVDSRALKGPLRDIQQGAGQDNSTPVNFNSFDFNSSLGSANFFPGVQSTIQQRPSGPIRQRSGSLDESFLSNALTNGMQNENLTGWTGQVTSDLNAYNLQGLDSIRGQQLQYQQQQQPLFTSTPQVTTESRPSLPGPQFSSRTQKVVDRAKAQKPTRKRLTRDRSGLTVSPQEAFLDYDNIESLIQATRAHSQTFPATVQNLFAPPPPGINAVFNHSEGTALTPKAISRENPISYAPSSLLSSTHEGTPSLVDASSSSSNGSRGNSTISSPLQRMPLNREDTVRPTKTQSDYATAQQLGQTNSDGLFSPAYSTTSSTDDEDEKPYEPPNQRANPNLNPTPNLQFPFPAQQTNSRTTHGPHHPHPNQQQQQQTYQAPHLSGPRFSVVSSSSSESEEEDQRNRLDKHAPVNQQGRRTMGGYGYMGSSEESGLSVVPPYFPQQFVQQYQQPALPYSSFAPYPSSSSSSSQIQLQTSSDGIPTHHQTPQSAGGNSDNQSQDEDPSISPSIRSSAQAIVPSAVDARTTGRPVSNTFQSGQQTQAQARQRSRSRNRAQAAAAATAANRRTSDAGTSSVGESSEWETGDDSEADGSDYQEEKRGATVSGGPKKSTSSTTKKRRRDNSTRQGGSGGGGGGWGPGSNSTSSTASHLTVCDYVSPLTGESCKTEFHRPYDLARHRETIHAREEALLLRQGRLKKEQCVVLYKEVDPEKSLATVEWKCEGKNGCGSLFSRKDALLRHKRIRGH